MKRIFGNGRYANVTATMALVVALGGTSYAAVALPKNSVSSKQIKKGAVKNVDLAKNAVTASKVKNGSLLAADFKAGQIPAGAKGDKGDQGPAGTFGAVTVQSTLAAADLADGTKQSYDAFCPAGQQAIGGGGRGDATVSEATSVTSSRPAVSAANTEPPANGGSFTGWRLTVFNPAGGVTTGIRPEVWVICVPAIAP
jgi:hypothetical protein